MHYENLIWTLKSKGFSVSSLDDGGLSIAVTENTLRGWLELFTRLNAVYDGPFLLDADEKSIRLHIESSCVDAMSASRILCEAVLHEEYKSYGPLSGKKLDLKLGYSCNNNCVHCCIKPELWRFQSQDPSVVVLDSGVGMHCGKDLSFDDVIGVLTASPVQYQWITLTGGEPTVRPDLLAIVKWLYYNRPHTAICLQTNGRNLADEKLVRALRRYVRKAAFTIAVHGLERTHNRIVNNRKDVGNPFEETIAGIGNVRKFFNDDRYQIRTETVVSRLNIAELVLTAKYLHETVGIWNIGFSYPHLAGFSLGAMESLIPPMDLLLQVMKELNAYVSEHPGLKVIFEQVPYCVFAQLHTPIHLLRFKDVGQEDVEISILKDKVPAEAYRYLWPKSLGKVATCLECCLEPKCHGLYTESLLLNGRHLKPIDKGRASEILDFIEGNCR